jgi:hypothetical protein
MYYPVLAVMVLGSVVGAVLVDLARRFTSQEKNNGTVLNAPRTTPMRRAAYPTKFAESSSWYCSALSS